MRPRNLEDARRTARWTYVSGAPQMRRVLDLESGRVDGPVVAIAKT
jgi:hypothetical protein